MSEQFRASMNWLHTWAGLVVGALLFAMFWMGTLSVFDREIDRWMMPGTRRAAVETVSLDAAARAVAPVAASLEAKRVGLQLPTGRTPTMCAFIDGPGGRRSLHLDPSTGHVVAEDRTLGAGGFFFPFHFMFHVSFLGIGDWLGAFAAMVMMALCVSGVAIHRRIFTDFFTLRIVRKPQRTTLDLHNVAGVLGLPFNFLIALSGLIILMSLYLPSVQAVLYPDGAAGFRKDAYGLYSRPALEQPGGLASLDRMAADASRRWGGDRAEFVNIANPGDAASTVTFYRSYERRVAMRTDPVVFDGPGGRVLSAHSDWPVMTAQRVISGMHFIQFRHWTLRWLYFVSGLTGCVLIATGFLFWSQSRAKRHGKDGVRGVALVRGLTAGATTGLALATLAFLIANRLLPDSDASAGMPRKSAEVRVFLVVWITAAGHGWLRPVHAWRDQTTAIACAAALAVVLNGLTTGAWPWRSIAAGQWGVAGVDVILILTTGVAAYAARRLFPGRPTSGQRFARAAALPAVPAE